MKLIQTHASWVFIAGDCAYKVKKPVNFGFLDYTTISARRFYCKEELRLNRLLSPDLYLGVLPIVERNGRLKIGGKGRVIDYCVKMRALPQSAIMTEKLKKGKVRLEDIDQLARIVAEFHQRAERGRGVSRYGSVKTIKFNWDENFTQTARFVGKTIEPDSFNEIKTTVEDFIFNHQVVFRQRQRAGFVRRCHGDLHSGNIFLLTRPYIFDCIEFNPRFSCSDVCSEVAFMAMDLDFFKRHDLANFFIERYLVYSQDEGLIPLLNFYQSYRAYVRGKVTSFQLNDLRLDRKAKVQAKVIARRYFALALRYTQLLKAKPWLLVVFGLPGSGKSYLAQRLAEKSLGIHLASDSIRKQIAGIPVSERRKDGYGRGLYSWEMSEKTYNELLHRAEVFLKGGQRVILDATFSSKNWRDKCRELGLRLKLPVQFVLVSCPEEVILKRLKLRTKLPGFSDAGIEVYQKMKDRWLPPQEGGVIEVDSTKPITECIRRVERALLHF